jgi:hypothetical protein
MFHDVFIDIVGANTICNHAENFRIGWTELIPGKLGIRE